MTFTGKKWDYFWTDHEVKNYRPKGMEDVLVAQCRIAASLDSRGRVRILEMDFSPFQGSNEIRKAMEADEELMQQVKATYRADLKKAKNRSKGKS